MGKILKLNKRNEKQEPLSWSEMDENWHEIEEAVKQLLDAEEVAVIISGHNKDATAHNDIRKAIENVIKELAEHNSGNNVHTDIRSLISNLMNGSNDIVEISLLVDISTGISYADLDSAMAEDASVYKISVDAVSQLVIQGGNFVVKNAQKTFEIHIVMPTPVVAVTWFPGIIWLDGGAPPLDAGKTSVFVFRTTEEGKFIGNLAYSY